MLVPMVLLGLVEPQLVDRHVAEVANLRLTAGSPVLAGAAGDRHEEWSRIVFTLDLDQPLQCDLPHSER